MIEAQSISKSFDLTKKQQKERNTTLKSITAVESVSLRCEPGKIHALLGPNGAGKTTTMRMLSTIFKPTAGNIFINGVDVLKNPNEARKQIGFLTGSAGLYGRLTPNELVDYFGQLYGLSKNAVVERKKKLFKELDVLPFENQRIAKLSTGQKQRVSICRTVIHDPQVIIFDEPTSGLDVISAASIIELIRSCKNEGKTVIFSSHIMSEVDLLCDDISIIHQGKMILNETMDTFRQNMTARNLTEEFIQLIQTATK